uniref:Carbamoyl phosphate synthase large chain n=1 Tax=uncultured gamma proteobacterium HF0070_08D07 TaxID=710983 RepID=E0XRU9_9GAMM|nr:carbamoylphosphate synthase large subunit (split gene in mj) [uncultured gamma proteobacterium HF0070_08D07]
MPKNSDINSVLIIGAGPIVIGQACEFDYSGAQACKALKEEGLRVVLVNSNPATIMTDPAMADATYIEPVNWKTVREIIAKERPDAILPTMGGQTALNCALDLVREGVLEEFSCRMIGASKEAIDKAEDRELFDKAMKKIGLGTPRSVICHSLEEAIQVQKQVGFPCIIRPSFTLGGSGGGIAYNKEEFEEICGRGLDLSPTSELLIDESLLGWKEFEMEVVRDKKDNCIIVCSIENFDPMGVHTGDSITVAPSQTLTDKEYQLLRDASIAVLREIGVETGGSNVQFAISPDDGRIVVIEMNPRVSRSSALASKATGFPIAKVAAKLAIGYTLDELENDITGGATPASFEPSIDYVVTKIPRFAFEKFTQADSGLTTQMKSVGEVMAIGSTFQESLQKAIRGLETGMSGLDSPFGDEEKDRRNVIKLNLRSPRAERLWFVAEAFREGFSLEDLHQETSIDRWFLAELEDLVFEEGLIQESNFNEAVKSDWLRWKRKGFSDHRLAQLLGTDEGAVRKRRNSLDVKPVFRRVDSCAGEFRSPTAYLYSTYEEMCEANPSQNQKIMVLGGGPNRIGQGIEFDYCCVHASQAIREEGFESIMVNCNPETVSTDYDTSDRLYFEPLTLEDVLAIAEVEQPQGVIVQFGGQTPLKLARGLESFGVPIIGTSPDAIDRAEDRERFQKLVDGLGLRQPANRLAREIDEAVANADKIGYPIVVRPSYVLGGRAMEIVYGEQELRQYMRSAVEVSNESPVLLDRFLDHALEVDVDLVSDGEKAVVGAIMQHIEQAGVHSGDSACSLPPYRLSTDIQNKIRQQTIKISKELGVVGLMNVQLAVQDGEIFLIEVNPRASRTIPFVSKCIGVSLAKIAARLMMGKSLKDVGFQEEIIPSLFHVKESVFPFNKFPGVDPILGPEMKSTGEVMGVGENFAEAFRKASAGAGELIPEHGRAFLSVKDSDKEGIVDLGKQLVDLGFEIVATSGTQRALQGHGLVCSKVQKVNEGRPDVADLLKNEQIDFIINTTEGRKSIKDSSVIRKLALKNKVFCSTTLAGGEAAIMAIRQGETNIVRRLQDLSSGHGG